MLTKRQAQVYAYVRDYLATRGYSPTLQEIADAHGLTSLATVHKHMTALQRKGYITRQWNGNRSARLTQLENCPTCGRQLNSAKENG